MLGEGPAPGSHQGCRVRGAVVLSALCRSRRSARWLIRGSRRRFNEHARRRFKGMQRAEQKN